MEKYENYGGTFNSSESEPFGFGNIALWHDVEETFPGGATLLPSETYPVGTKFPGGIPIEVTNGVPGATPILNSTTPTGLSKDDRVMGSNGCTFTVVTRGEIYAKRTHATITAAQKTFLAGRIGFINA